MDFKKIIKILLSFGLYIIMMLNIIFFSKYIYYKPYRINTGYSIISPIIYAKKLINIMSFIFILFYLWRVLLKNDFFYLINLIIIIILLISINYFI
ncbi:hypothetical protein Ga0061079_105143 [Apibacter mensalis]|jgi:hypothetical protein|uniref:Uncharacterized protein n=1 Tax=Apibacter mensalis TaxID=1586267 RepID=A0A0X3AP96_9FLAO|nr:hypothetical protein Ga0061079_105143 [Apibacter mensalis]